MGRGLHMLCFLFGDVATVVAEAETYMLDRPEPLDFDMFTMGLTAEQEAELAKFRECVKFSGPI